MNTPDTEKKCCEMCERHAGIPPTKRMSQLHGTPFCGDTNCHCHMPDTEVEDFPSEISMRVTDIVLNKESGWSRTLHNELNAYKNTIVASRDTYWKERMKSIQKLYEDQCVEEIGFVVKGDKVWEALDNLK